MGLGRRHFLVLFLALIGLGAFGTSTRPLLLLSRWDVALPSADVAAHALISATHRSFPEGERPFGNPLRDRRTVVTQGYGVGTHAPAHIWGGIDLAIDGDGDGRADPQGTWHVPVYATHDGSARVRPDTWPGGNYLAIENARYKTAYAHLHSYAVVDGQTVTRGQVIGYVGSTGMSSGPHLHYEVWENGVNCNPLDFDALHTDE